MFDFDEDEGDEHPSTPVAVTTGRIDLIDSITATIAGESDFTTVELTDGRSFTGVVTWVQARDDLKVTRVRILGKDGNYIRVLIPWNKNGTITAQVH